MLTNPSLLSSAKNQSATSTENMFRGTQFFNARKYPWRLYGLKARMKTFSVLPMYFSALTGWNLGKATLLRYMFQEAVGKKSCCTNEECQDLIWCMAKSHQLLPMLMPPKPSMQTCPT